MRNHSIAALLVLALVAATGCDTIRARMLLREGNEFYRGERYEEAIGRYRQILEFDPDHWDANYLVAVSYLAMYHPGSTHPKDVEAADQAAKGLRRCLDLVAAGKAPTPEAADKVHGFYLTILTSANRTDEAVAYLESLLAKAPSDTNLMGELAGLYGKKGDFPNALRYYKARAEQMKDNKEAWYTIGVACWDRSYHGGILVSNAERETIIDEGMKALERALQIDPEYFEALSYTNLLYRERAKVLGMAGRAPEAGLAYLKADEYMKKAEAVKKQKEGA